MGIRKTIISKNGLDYWLVNRDEILSRMNSNGKLNLENPFYPNRFLAGDNAKDRRKKARRHKQLGSLLTHVEEELNGRMTVTRSKRVRDSKTGRFVTFDAARRALKWA